LFEPAAVGGFLCPGGLLDVAELHEGVVPFHVDSHQFPEWFEQHLQIFSFRGFLLEIHHKESIGRLDVLATIVLLAFDPPVSPSTLGTHSRRNIWNRPGQSIVCKSSDRNATKQGGSKRREGKNRRFFFSR